MNRGALLVFFLTAFLLVLAFNSSRAVAKPDVTSHEATFLGNTVNMHVEWQSPNPIVMVRISVGNKQKDIKVDPYDNRRNPSGYAGEVTVTIGLDWVPTQPFNYVIQLEDDLRIKSALVTGKVKVPLLQQQPGMVMQPQQPGMQIQIQQGLSQPTFQSPQQPGTQPFPQPGIGPGLQVGGQQAGTVIVIIVPQIVADSGAMWRVGNGPWKKSGEAIPNLPAGINTIEFQEVLGWKKPDNQSVMIEVGKTISLSGAYSQ